MYNAEDLQKYPYFNNLLSKNDLENIIDPLTGVVNRRYMLEFVEDLISKKKPFTMAILDLDDFKHVNDTYGHLIGDYLLETVGSDLQAFVGDTGVAGRFGGDEFIIVIFGKGDYDEIHEFYHEMFHDTVLRKHFKHNDIDFVYTGTIGSAKYPDNGASFDELFQMSDKTLYRGKSKGRNCFIIYISEKHKMLEIQKIQNDDEVSMVFNINSFFDQKSELNQKLIDVSEYISANLHLDKMFVVLNDKLYDMNNMSIILDKIDMSEIKFNNELHKIENKTELKNKSFGAAILECNVSSLLMTTIKAHHKILGYVMYGLKRTGKIWENSEIAVLMYLAKTIALDITLNNK